MRSSVEEFSSRLVVAAGLRMGDEWERLDAEAQDDVAMAIRDHSELLLAKVAGEDVDQDLLEVEAAIANWSFVGAGAARRAVYEILGEAARVAAEFLVSLVEQLAKRLGGAA